LGRLDESISQMFNLPSTSVTTGYLKAQTSPDAPGIIGYVEIAANGGSLRTTTPVAGQALSRMIFSDIAQGHGYFTGIALLNTGTESAVVTIEVDSADGTVLASKTVTLGTNERSVGLISELFPNLQNQMGGFVRITSTVPIYGLQIIGTADQRL